MPSLIPSAKATLSYPLYDCDFDPLDSSRLVVGGGGGAGRSGVGNKITLLDTSKTGEITEAAEVVLSREEDNVTSLAVGRRKGNATLVYAGVNSSPQDVAAGKNRHFRTFALEGVARKGQVKAGVEEKAGAHSFAEVSRETLFSGKEKDIYQRILRLSRPYLDKLQLGAVATGLSKSSEIVLFDTATSPTKTWGSVQSNKEAVDVDFLQTGDDEFLFAYCDVHDIYVKRISPGTDAQEPYSVYETPGSKSTEKVAVPAFRAMRWLTNDLLLMLTNVHSNSGVVLQILRLPSGGKEGQSRIAQSLRLPKLKKATGMAVVNLTPPVSPTSPQGYTQVLIAVAGQDFSISLFKVDLQVEGVTLPTTMKPFRTFDKVHPFTITSLAFSIFTPPAHPITASTPPQYLKLASVSVNNTVVVHTLPLFPVPLSVKRGQSKTPRYVVALPSQAAAFGMTVIVSIIAIILGAIAIQGFLEIKGGVPIWLNTRNNLPLRIQEALGRPYEFPSGYNSVPTSLPAGHNHHLGVPADPPASPLPDFLQNLKTGNPDDVYVITDYDGADGSESGPKAHLHDEETQGPHGGKSWDELHPVQKESLKRKLKDAGYWAEDMGETLLKGVVFGELAGAVGQAVAG
ncbi:hypothetical protein LSUE1_G000948 [Lachnellula suecica]|uniref:Guanine nucleotide-exchange factor SEC12 n=1 Tax=Lachnellula suecica TaxID=602035 RepID=A0A8T9CF29_9HELO|nr:hypothetical protein LSUE1_G000948 [Lachnellula suecica]